VTPVINCGPEDMQQALEEFPLLARPGDIIQTTGSLRVLAQIMDNLSRAFRRKGWLPIAKLKPLVERYSCHPMRSLDTSNNLSVGPSCM